MIRFPFLAALLALPAAAQPVPTQGLLGVFYAAQELPVFTPDELAARHKLLGDGTEAIAADQALNDWKLCVQDSLVRWSVLKPGPGTLVDGAYGRCFDLQRQYRDHLMRITQNGRTVVDAQLARSLTRLLEDSWRPRLVAAALDDELVHQGPAPGGLPPVLPRGAGSATAPPIRPRA